MDNSHQVIVAARATDQPSDKGQALSMIEETIGNVGAVPKEVSADAGYYLAKAVDGLYDLGVDPLRRAGEDPPRLGTATGAPWPHTHGTVSQGPDAPQAADETGQGTLRPSNGDVEPVFGQIKQGRGFRQFLLRGLAKVNREWLLICADHNLLKLFRFGAGMSGRVGGKGATGNNRETCRTMGSGIFKRQSACA